jgi:hypothetical protein
MANGPVKTAYVLLFRGVGGATQLPTAPLRAALTAAGFENVASYINSGNAVLRSHLTREQVIASVAEICKSRFGFTKAILAPTLEEWSALIGNNPPPLPGLLMPCSITLAPNHLLPSGSSATVSAAPPPPPSLPTHHRDDLRSTQSSMTLPSSTTWSGGR